MGSKKSLRLESLVITLLDRKMKPVKGKFKEFYVQENPLVGISLADEEGKIAREYGNFRIKSINYSSYNKKITMNVAYQEYISLGKPSYIEVRGKKIKKIN